MTENEFDKFRKILSNWKIEIIQNTVDEKEYFIEIKNDKITFQSPVYPNIFENYDTNISVLNISADEVSISPSEFNAITKILESAYSLIKEYIEKKRMNNPYIQAILYLEEQMTLTGNDTLQNAIDILENVPDRS